MNVRSGKQQKSQFTGEYFEKDFFFFHNFPIVDYDIDGTGHTIAIRNFLRRFGFRESIRENTAAFSEWIIRDEDTPEVMAHRLYDSTHLYWIILMFNQLCDPLFDWPLTDRELYRFCQKKYGVDQLNTLHHYESKTPVEVEDLPEGIIVDHRYLNKNAISNYQHEFQLNEKKRFIRLLKPEYLPALMNEWETIKKSNMSMVI